MVADQRYQAAVSYSFEELAQDRLTPDLPWTAITAWSLEVSRGWGVRRCRTASWWR